MKILFFANLSGNFCGIRNIKDVVAQDCSGLGLSYPLNLLAELGKYMDVDVYSPPLKGYVDTQPLLTNCPDVKFNPQKVAIPEETDIAEASKGYDVALVYAESIHASSKNLEKAQAKKVLWFLSSPHQIMVPQYKELCAQNVDLVIKVADKDNRTVFGKKFVEKGFRTEWLPLSVDGKRFRKLDAPKVADVCLLGNLNPAVYPLRLKAYQYLLHNTGRYRLILDPTYGERYVLAINMSRVFLTCSGGLKYPVMKYFEAMACGTLLFADTPMDAEALGFRAEKNFVSLDGYSDELLEEKLQHYFTCVDDASLVAQAGEKLVRERHTDEVRAKELYGMLKG